MARIRIRRRSGARSTSGGVRIAWRKVSASLFRAVISLGKDPLRALRLSQPAAHLPPEQKHRVVVDEDPDAGLLYLRLAADDDRDDEVWSLHWKQGCAHCALPMDWPIQERQPATKVRHRVEGGELVITLPPWARATAQPRPAIPLVEPPSAPAKPQPGTPEFAARVREGMARAKAAKETSQHRTGAAALHTPKASDADPRDPLLQIPPDDLAEARQMMRAPSCSASTLAEHFGWQRDLAVRIAAAIRDEMTMERAA